MALAALLPYSCTILSNAQLTQSGSLQRHERNIVNHCVSVAQAEVRVLQKGVERKLRVSLRSPHRLIPVHIRGRPPPYFILGGLVFTQVPRKASHMDLVL